MKHTDREGVIAIRSVCSFIGVRCERGTFMKRYGLGSVRWYPVRTFCLKRIIAESESERKASDSTDRKPKRNRPVCTFRRSEPVAEGSGSGRVRIGRTKLLPGLYQMKKDGFRSLKAASFCAKDSKRRCNKR